jgi:hypothetical protein
MATSWSLYHPWRPDVLCDGRTCFLQAQHNALYVVIRVARLTERPVSKQRVIPRKRGERAKLWSRRGADSTDRFSSATRRCVRGLSADVIAILAAPADRAAPPLQGLVRPLGRNLEPLRALAA